MRIATPLRQPSRSIRPERKALLAVAAGGRCEFRDCNKYLLEHPISLSGLNLSERAHIYPFSGENGPRSEEGGRPGDIHSITNLMLLCGDCHKEIDKNEERYPVAALSAMKSEHENRIRYLTSLGENDRTSLLVFKGMIANRVVDITFDEMRDAVAPRFPADRNGFVVDVTQTGIELTDGYFTGAEKIVQARMQEFYDRSVYGTAPKHVSAFGLASIPLLVLFGRHVSDKVPVEFYQRHHDMQSMPWRWQNDPRRLKLGAELAREGTNQERVGLLVSLSGVIDPSTVPAKIWNECPVFEIRVTSELPDRRVLRRREDLAEFRRAYGDVLARIGREYPKCTELHLFLAAPAPVAMTCGHERLPKVQPTLHVYDNIRNEETQRNSFVPRLTIR